MFQQASETFKKSIARFDQLIVDEPRDILSETELLMLDSLIEGGLDSGNWMFAYDGDQSLSGSIEAGLEYLRTRNPKEYFLNTNLRTPASSYNLACATGGLALLLPEKMRSWVERS